MHAQDERSLLFFRKRGRIPITPERMDLQRKCSIREVVFGLQDGVLTVLGIITGVDVATSSPVATSIVALLAGITGMISMAMGEYLASRAESSVITATIAAEQAQFELDPEKEFAEQVQFLREKGFSLNDARRYTRTLAKNPEVWMAEMLRDEYGIDVVEAGQSSSIKNAVIIGAAFGIGAALPTIAFMLAPHMISIPILVALGLLGGVGAIAGYVSRTNPLKSAVELAFAGAILLSLTMLSGSVLAKLITHFH